MPLIEDIVRFNIQTSAREKLIRLCHYMSRLILNSGTKFNLITSERSQVRLLELELYFLSCRRLITFGSTIDHIYTAVRCLRIEDPIVRFLLMLSKSSASIYMVCDHILWLREMNLFPYFLTRTSSGRVNENFKRRQRQFYHLLLPYLGTMGERWTVRGEPNQFDTIIERRYNKFWLYASSLNLMRDIYEIICILLSPSTHSHRDSSNEFNRQSHHYSSTSHRQEEGGVEESQNHLRFDSKNRVSTGGSKHVKTNKNEQYSDNNTDRQTNHENWETRVVENLGRRLGLTASDRYARWRSWPIDCIARHPALACDLAKNLCDFYIPYTMLKVDNASKKSTLLALLGVTSSALSAWQIYNPKYRLVPS